jgi:ribosome maturation factor RimP
MAGRPVGDDLEEAVRAEIKPLIEGLGYRIVEMALGRSHRLTHLRLVIHREPGITVHDCTLVSRTVRPRLELIEGLADLEMEVSSPGIDRKLKTREEYDIFRNRGVRVLLNGRSEWTGGIIKGIEGDLLSIEQEEGLTVINLADIRAARLDQGQEVRR